METKQGIVRLTRKQLYDDIWELSVAGVAKKYNLHYATLLEVCKIAEIPYPSSGYWVKRNCGKDVSAEVVSLTGDKNAMVELLAGNSGVKRIKKFVMEEIEDDKRINEEMTVPLEKNVSVQNAVAIYPVREGLEFLEHDEKQRVLQLANTLVINDHTHLHTVLVQYKKKIENYSKQIKATQKLNYYNRRYNEPVVEEPQFFKEVSENGTKRFMGILDVVFKAVEKMGGSVNDDLSMVIRNEIVRIRVAESKDKVKHEITKQEAQELIKYQDEVKRYSWASKPRIRQYDHIYNGRMRIIFGEKSYIRDSEKEKLEERLGDIFVALYEKSEENRIERERREEEQRRRDEEARRQEEIRKRKEREIRLTEALANKAEDYRIALDIRAYIDAMIKNNKRKASAEWIEWAKQKADWFDPTIAREDEYLGKRDHGKKKEDKDLEKNNVRSWLW